MEKDVCIRLISDVMKTQALNLMTIALLSFFAQKVLTFPVFYGIINDIHSDDSFGIVVLATSILL